MRNGQYGEKYGENGAADRLDRRAERGLKMSEETRAAVTLEGNIDRKTFRRFAMFDTFTVKRRWKSPALFALILSAFAGVCFMGRQTREQAVLLGSVLLGVGLTLPLVWVGMYALSVSGQAKRMGLSADKAQYYVTLSPEKIHVEKGKETADFSWENAYRAFRTKDCIYLYVSIARAFLLPDCEKTEPAWAMIVSRLGSGKAVVTGRNHTHENTV